MKKIDARKQTREELQERRKLVIQLRLKGTPVMQIVEDSGLSWYAVNNAIKLYKEDNESVLNPLARGRKQGTGRSLSEEQEAMIRKLICTRRPWQTGTDGYRFLWNRNLVLKLLEQKYAIKLSAQGIGKYLIRWGFVLKNPNKRADERCSLAIQKWLYENYPEIKQRALDEDAEIHWASKTAVIGQPYKDKKRWMISATNNQGKIRWLIIKGAFNQGRQIKFLEALVKDSRKKVFLIRDVFDVYHKGLVLPWIRENKEKIELFPDPTIPLNKDANRIIE